MNLSNYELYLTDSIQNLHDLTHLDMAKYSSKLELTHDFQSNPLPISIGLTKKEHLQIQDLLSESKFKDFCYAITNHHLEYLFIPISHKKIYQGFLKIGPFISTPVTQSMIASIVSRAGFPLEYRNIIENYYTSLSVLSYDGIINIGYVSYNLINSHQVLVKPVFYQTAATNQPLELITHDHSQQDLIEERYKVEKQILYAIEIGDTKLFDKLILSFASIFNLEERTPGNPLRSAKNMAFVVNTLSRIAAERGGLHPLLLHSLSEKYAILIEKATSSSEIDRLNRELAYEYLDAVNNHTYQDIGPTVKNIIQHIQFHLADSLTPTTLGKIFKQHPSNISGIFKKEMNMPITKFVQQLRVKEACYHLRFTENNIKDISHLLGFLDQNYFTRVFKHIMGVTPTQYRIKNS